MKAQPSPDFPKFGHVFTAVFQQRDDACVALPPCPVPRNAGSSPPANTSRELRNRALRVLLLLLFMLPAGFASAQVDVTLTVNYGSAYRDGTWVPVDVTVVNEGSAIDGWVELKKLAFSGIAQSPLYRVRAQCPQGSRKRFRLHCLLEGTDQIEARLYHGSRPVARSESWRKFRPIDVGDALTLILDERVTDYGFLSSITFQEDVRRRFHRENLKNESLALLADYPQCFRSFDVIILGDIDPRLIRPRHRSLIRGYVERGGKLVVFTGAHSTRYQGTWVEELMGARIGPQEVIDGQELARKVFSPDDQTGARNSRHGVLATLSVMSPQVEASGKELVLATHRPLGQGVVVGLALDASSRLLQECAGYRKLWLELYGEGGREAQIDLHRALERCSQALPSIVGIAPPSRESVLIYLGLYFLVGILGSWLLCNRLRRRELAWVFLVVFSAGFTGYAMVRGTGTTSSADSIVQIDLFRIPREGSMADLHSLFGIITPRTSVLSAPLEGEYALVRDSSGPHSGGGGRSSRIRSTGLFGRDLERPLRLVQETPPRIENLTVPAKSLRLIEVERQVKVPGRIHGALVRDDNGLKGVLTNKTGYNVSEPLLLFEGGIYKVGVDGDHFKVDLSPNVLKMGRTKRFHRGQYGWPRDTEGLRRLLVSSLFAGQKPVLKKPGRRPRALESLNEDYGPFVFGWCRLPRIDVIRPDRPVKELERETLVIFDVKVERKKQQGPIGTAKMNDRYSESRLVAVRMGSPIPPFEKGWGIRADLFPERPEQADDFGQNLWQPL